MTIRAKSVLCVETGHVYQSRAECAGRLGVSSSAVSMAIRRGSLCQGVHLRDVDAGPGTPPPVYTHGRAVIDRRGRWYPTCKAAARACGVPEARVYNDVKRRGKDAYFADAARALGESARVLYAVDFETYFVTPGCAARWCHMPKGDFMSAIAGKDHKAGGSRWRFVNVANSPKVVA